MQFSTILIFVSLFFGSLSNSLLTHITRITPLDPKLHWIGRLRFNLDATLSFDWESTSWSFVISNSTLASIDLQVPLNTSIKFRTYINNDDNGIFYANSNQSNYFIASGLDTLLNYTIQVFTASEPKYQLECTKLSFPSSSSSDMLAPTLRSISTDGFFLKAPSLPSRKMVFIGDEITAGGGAGGIPPCTSNSVTSDASLSYANLLARNFSAELLGLIAWSGKGLLVNTNDDTSKVFISDYLLQRLGMEQKTRNWEFNYPSRPDVIVINIGSIDFLNNRGDNETFVNEFIQEYITFVKNISLYHSSNYSTFFLAVGPVTDAHGPAVMKVVSTLSMAPLYLPVFYLNLMEDSILDGCESLPGRLGHIKMAEIAYPIISLIMGWNNSIPSSFIQDDVSDGQTNSSFTYRFDIIERRNEIDSFNKDDTNDLNLTIRTDGTGDFSSIQAALNYCNATINRNLGHVTLHIFGIFRERVFILPDFSKGISLIGDGISPFENLIIYNMSNYDSSFGTWADQTVMVQAKDVTFVNIAIANDAGFYNAAIAGQSVALHIDVTADRFACFSCVLLGGQDTVYTGGSGYGLRSYFFDTFSNGTTDGWFGGSSTVLEQNTIDMSYTIFAPRGDPNHAFLILDSVIKTQSSVLLGRPWGQISTVVFKNTYMSSGILSQGWSDWDHKCTESIPGTYTWCSKGFYAEINSTGPGSDLSKRVWWEYTNLSPEQSLLWNKTRVLQDWEPIQTVSKDAAIAILNLYPIERLEHTFGKDTITNLIKQSTKLKCLTSDYISSDITTTSTLSSTFTTPILIFNVKSFGAIGDGKTNDTRAIQEAFLVASSVSSGSIVLFPGPAIYLSWPLLVPTCSNLTVQFEDLAQLLAPKMSQWPLVQSQWPYGNSFFKFNGGSNIKVHGYNKYSIVLDGQGIDWWIAFNKSGISRPSEFWTFENINGLLVENLRYINSPNFHIVIKNCTNAIFQDLSIYAPGNSPNTDGIDPSKSNFITIQRVNISNGDDCIAIKSGTSNVLIQDSYFENGHGASIGSLGENGAHDLVQNILVRNCTFVHTQGAAKVKAWQGGHGLAINLTWTNLTFISVQTPIQLTQFYCPHDPKGCLYQNSTISIKNVTISNVIGTQSNGVAGQFNCTILYPCLEINLLNITITSDQGVDGKNIFLCSNVSGLVNNVLPRACY